MLMLQNQNIHPWLVRREYKNQSSWESLSLILQRCSSVNTGEVIWIFSCLMKTILIFDAPFSSYFFAVGIVAEEFSSVF